MYNLNKINKPVDKLEWGMGVYDVNAYYDPSTNQMVFPAGILQKPFFEVYNEEINYGAIGAVMGHELSHGFDDQGVASTAALSSLTVAAAVVCYHFHCCLVFPHCRCWCCCMTSLPLLPSPSRLLPSQSLLLLLFDITSTADSLLHTHTQQSSSSTNRALRVSIRRVWQVE